MAFDHVITWQIKNIISQLLQRLQPPSLVGTHTRIKWYHCYMSGYLLYVIYYIPICHSQCNFHEDYNHQYWWKYHQNEMVAYLHVTWPNHAKVTAPKVASQQATWSLITWYLDKWKKHVVIFTKVFRHQV